MKEGGRMDDHDIISEVRSKVDIVESVDECFAGTTDLPVFLLWSIG